tara:strand:+ start:928 stop:1707 length:780 start_codon:yes stop_codon:yes gene_type:complete
MKSKLCQIIVLLTFPLISLTQTPYSSWELGAYGGGAYYLGELNQNHFPSFNFSFGPRLRYNYDQRIAIKGLLTIGEISADDANSINSFNTDRNFAFTSQLIEAAIVGEFNFLPYSALDSKSRLATPFLFLGIGFTKHNPKAQLNGILLSTQSLQTEGVNFKKNILSVPFGVGYKIMANRFGFEFTWGIRKTNSDYLDDVSTNFIDTSNSSSGQTNIGNTTQYENVANVKRGDQYNKDWYVFSGLTIFVNLTPEEVCRKM